MKYSIDIPSTEKCPARWEGHRINSCHILPSDDDGLMAACVGLGNGGCPFKPEEEQSCETCQHRDHCEQVVREYWQDHYKERKPIPITHCSAYIKE